MFNPGSGIHYGMVYNNYVYRFDCLPIIFLVSGHVFICIIYFFGCLRVITVSQTRNLSIEFFICREVFKMILQPV